MGREANATKPSLADRCAELERVVGLLAQFHNSLVKGSFLRRLKFLFTGR